MTPPRRAQPQETAPPSGLARRQRPYLTMAGRGELAGPLFEAKVAALYSVGYAIKLTLAKTGREFAIAGIELLRPKPPGGAPCWKLGIPAPSNLTQQDVAAAAATLAAKGKDPLVKDVLLESLDEESFDRLPLLLDAATAGSLP